MASIVNLSIEESSGSSGSAGWCRNICATVQGAMRPTSIKFSGSNILLYDPSEPRQSSAADTDPMGSICGEASSCQARSIPSPPLLASFLHAHRLGVYPPKAFLTHGPRASSLAHHAGLAVADRRVVPALQGAAAGGGPPHGRHHGTRLLQGESLPPAASKNNRQLP